MSDIGKTVDPAKPIAKPPSKPPAKLIAKPGAPAAAQGRPGHKTPPKAGPNAQASFKPPMRAGAKAPGAAGAASEPRPQETTPPSHKAAPVAETPESPETGRISTDQPGEETMSPAVENEPAKGASKSAAEGVNQPPRSDRSAEENSAGKASAPNASRDKADAAPRDGATTASLDAVKRVEAPGTAVARAATSQEMAAFGQRQVRDAYERMRCTAEEIGRTCLDTGRGVAGLQARMVVAAGENTLVCLDLARDLSKARTVSDAAEAQTHFLQRQCETLTAQARDMSALSTKLVQDVARPPAELAERVATATRDRS